MTTETENATLPTLGQFIDWLAARPGQVVPLAFDIHSDRGDYAQVAITPGSATTDGLADYLRSKVGDTMHGWKGGAYSIREDCAVFVANHGVMGPRLGLMDDRVILVGDGWDVR